MSKPARKDYTTREDRMRAPERRRLVKLVAKYILEHGGSPGRAASIDTVGFRGARLPTMAGTLLIDMEGFYGAILCRFEDVVAATRAMNPYVPARLDWHSGKYNFHFGKTWDAARAFKAWTWELEEYKLMVTDGRRATDE